jgi:glycosyltransferase involved in cell wall biosynthesis
MALRVLTVYHAGRIPEHRARQRALAGAGAELTLVVPASWPEPGSEDQLSAEPFEIVELAVRRAGDVNRHAYAEPAQLRAVIERVRPDVLDLHEEPFSVAARQWLRAAGLDLPAVAYTAQNIDKRFPPPFAGYERRALRRLGGIYPCSHQAASVVRGKGFAGQVEVLPLGYDAELYRAGQQTLAAEELTLLLAGRLVPEKGVTTAVRVLAAVDATRPARLLLVGEGPAAADARSLAAALGVERRLEIRPWLAPTELAELYRETHVLLIPSRATETWVEQYGRVITEAQASGAVVAGYASGAIAEVAGEPGIIVAPGEFDRLAQRVTAAVSDASEFDRRRDGGLRAVAERSWDAIARRQLALYEAVAGAAVAPLTLPGSPRARRAGARAEFGAPATTPAGPRPFALPLLRRSGLLSRLAGRVIDAAAELAARLT